MLCACGWYFSPLNNMMFNEEKFELLWYTMSGEPIEFYYKTPVGLNIDHTSKTPDVGVVILDTANFTEQISNVAVRAR